MSWLVVTAPLVVGVFLVVVPGLVVAASMRMRGIDAVAIAPAISVAMIAISAIIAPVLGISWALWVPLAFALVTALVLYLLTRILLRLQIWDAPRKRSEQKTPGAGCAAPNIAEPRWFSREQGLYWASLVIAAILLARNTTNAIGYPEWISQTYDNIFHLNAVRYIADHANGSSLFVASMTSGGNPPDFYPAAWHDTVSLMFTATGTSIELATSAMALLACAVIWPLSLVFMVRSTLRPGPVGILSIGVLSAAFIAFPLLLLNFGVLYPNLLGITLMPVGIAVIAQMLRVTPHRLLTTAQSVCLGLFVALGIALSHPNAIMSLLVMIIPIFICRALLQIIRGIKKLTPRWVVVAQVLGITVLLLLINYLWGVIRPPREAGGWEPQLTQAQSFGEFILNGVMDTGALWLVSILAAIGAIILCLDRNRGLWLLGSWAVISYFYTGIRYLGWDQDRDWITGVWYHDPYRVAALTPIVMIPLAVLAVDRLAARALESNLARSLYRRWETRETSTVSGPQAGLVTLTLVVLLGIGFFGQTAKPLTDYVADTYWTYSPDSDTNATAGLLTSDEKEVLEHVDDYVPEDATILVQPWTGGSLAYAIADRKVTAYHTSFTDTELSGYLSKNLNRINTDPRVCELINEHDARYYLDFGTQEVHGGSHRVRFSGYTAATETGAMTPLYSDGQATLYEITACN